MPSISVIFKWPLKLASIDLPRSAFDWLLYYSLSLCVCARAFDFQPKICCTFKVFVTHTMALFTFSYVERCWALGYWDWQTNQLTDWLTDWLACLLISCSLCSRTWIHRTYTCVRIDAKIATNCLTEFIHQIVYIARCIFIIDLQFIQCKQCRNGMALIEMWICEWYAVDSIILIYTHTLNW